MSKKEFTKKQLRKQLTALTESKGTIKAELKGAYKALKKLKQTLVGHKSGDDTLTFTDLKKIVKEEVVDLFDHATVFNKNTPHVDLANHLKDLGHHVLLVDYQPTSEMMVVDFSKKIKARLPENIHLFSLKLQETETCFAEWFASDNA